MNKKIVTVVVLLFTLMMSASLMVYISYNKKVWESENMQNRVNKDVMSVVSGEQEVELVGIDIYGSLWRMKTIDDARAASGDPRLFDDVVIKYVQPSGSTVTLTTSNSASYINNNKIFKVTVDSSNSIIIKQ